MALPLSRLTNLPVQGGMNDENGNLTQQWRLFFQDLYTRVGGNQAPTNSTLATSGNTNAGAITSLTTQTNSNTTAITGLTTSNSNNATAISNLTTTTNGNTTSINNLTTTSNNNATTVSNLTTSTNANTTAIATLNAAPGAVVVVTVGASPFVYKASQKGALVISGGALRRVEITRDGTTFYSTGAFRGMFPLSTNDSIRVTFTTAPVLTYFPT